MAKDKDDSKPLEKVAQALSRFRVMVRHAPIPKALKLLEVMAASEDEAWPVYLREVKARLDGLDTKEAKYALKLLEDGMVDSAHKTITRL